MRPILHIIIHFVFPGAVSRFFYKDKWLRAWILMCATMVVDADHFFANPLYDPNRCGIGFHPMHSYIAIGGYCLMAATPRLRIIGIGLLIHMALDGIDCLWIA